MSYIKQNNKKTRTQNIHEDGKLYKLYLRAKNHSVSSSKQFNIILIFIPEQLTVSELST